MNVKEKLLLIAVLLLGFFFRFYGIDFDRGCCQHPDERAIVMFALPLTIPTSIEQFLSVDSPANPHFFAYGNFPLYLLKSASVIAGTLDPLLAEYSKVNLVGRFITIIFDLATIFLIFLIARTLSNNRLGLAAAFIYASSVLPIQYSHFFTSDILLTFFVMLTLWRSIKLYNNPNFLNAALIGIAFGFALVTKISAIPLGVAVLAALTVDFIFVFQKSPHKIASWLPHLPKLIKKLVTEGVIIVGATLVTFVIIQPYALIDFGEFIKQNLAQSKMTNDAYTFPYTLQYVGKIPYIYEFKNIFLWGLGPVITIFAAAGIYLTFKRFKDFKVDKKSEWLILFSFAFLYFLIIGRFAIGFMRYLLPIYPILAILAGVTLISVLQKLDGFKNVFLKNALYLSLIFLILIWPLSYLSIYSNTNTRIEASEWIYRNIPENIILTHEIWDDQIPINSSSYKIVELGLYDQPDDHIKWQRLNTQINSANYIVLASNRLYTPIQNLADCTKYKVCFPIAANFYKDLFSEKLGFKKIAEFSSYPTIPILNIPIIDDQADESFTVYDHPKIIIFGRTK